MGSKRSDLPMRIEKLAREDVVTASQATTVRELAETMFDRSVGSVVIVESDEPVGIVTDRDLTVKLLAGEGDVNLFETERDLTEITAADVMTADPLVVNADDELPRVLHHMDQAHARRIPVVDDGALVGILALDDVVIHLAGESAHVSAQLDNVASVIRSESPEQ
ncbi:CBS domain-containing protein (plasmid) [Halorussus salilacus]|jgi:CBS domain-containing protein|uniref:CBS domain-containing protein n=1 Tax=Halorussus salilacus TaxID=2953750 RepID=UPI00209DFA96|nr:CBS domain-containing protein [Halorussus salilacus]USZ70113.1 CBS domain-containing protein [Halorussus salilacus]